MVFMDKRGNFFGYLTFGDKKNFALKLLEAGLAQVSYQGKNVPRQLELLNQTEEAAKEQEIGIWGKSLKIMSGNAAELKFEQDERVQMEMCDLTDGKNFHLRMGFSDDAEKIDDAMESFIPSTTEPMERPINKGTLCAARFSEDQCWYRARILGPAPRDHKDKAAG